ncbi:hypothetical protein [Actinoplanes utahensis]|uniref:Uncharacterized protein n=1 Tax=Actinoplanes utahensis TaxID=1869 RepID=A0A0A6UHA8_ACTUT|nr:hypothetical protein [Actinoplanes utahensis]KHD74478.1 hypothetical protein MB27_28580 [Actinoplanes utahensis]GIF31450.1 hypothetical protein Aut01nite_44360 [Actinoplanes utahensis]
MTTDSVPAGDPRRLLSDTTALARRVRVDQRVTWFALLVLAVVTLVAIPFDWWGLEIRCSGTGDAAACRYWRRGAMFYWPPALLLAYAAIAYGYARAARERGLGTRIRAYALTGATLTAVFTASWLAARLYLYDNPPAEPFPTWVLKLDLLVSPAGTIGVALLVLARLERNLALLAFTLAYLAVVVVPIDFGWGRGWGLETTFLPQQVVNATVLLLGAAAFALARRRQP